MSRSDLQLAYEAIRSKQNDYNEVFAYYDGDQPLVYANDRLREIFKGSQIRFTENWCRLVVDAVKERIQIGDITVPERYQELLGRITSENYFSVVSDDVHEAILITGEAYLIVWPDPETQKVEIYYNDPRLCHAFYHRDHPRKMRMAAKLWISEEDECYRMILYYPDRLEYYKTTQKASSVSNWQSFVPDDSEYPGGKALNPFGKIPVFHFRLYDRVLHGDLHDVIPIQNGINKLLTDMMVAAEYGAFKQRWIISNADVSVLKNAPNEIWYIPAGDGTGQSSQVGEFSSTDLGNYLDAVERLAADISRISRVPLHYFYARGNYPSGDSLVAMEAPLNFKVRDRIERFEPIWREAIAFALQIEGAEITPQEIVINWLNVQILQPETTAKVRLLNVQSGIPLEISLKREGWTSAEIEDLREAQQVSSAELGEKLLAAFDRGQ
ncbi:MAG: phage portal protein [Candidatus Methanomethylicaceae archaeon]